MSIDAKVIEGPLPRELEAAGAGAVLTFEGIVRPLEDARPLRALRYEAYEPMASRELARLAAETVARHGLLALAVHHSRGRVPVGECSLRLVIRSAHRAEALAAAAEFIDRLKRDVPIWKHPEWAE